MQLNAKSVKASLAAGAYALLGAASVASAASVWEVETGASTYVEMDDRISVFSFAGAVKKDFGDEKVLKLKLAVDTVSGASPNGAAPSDNPQTFTSPSGNTVYTTNPGDTPMDPTFRDSRFATSANWSQPLTDSLKGQTGAFLSSETDHISAGFNGGVSKDFNQRNTTLFAGLSFEYDLIAPIGGVPGAMVYTGKDVVKSVVGEEESMTIAEGLLGITQVVSRRLLIQLNYSYSQSSGYLDNPYKLLSAVDPASGRTLDHVFERRPDSRTKESVFWRMKYAMDSGAMDLSYRYMWDSWRIRSHTAELKYAWSFVGGSLEPSIRYYSQSSAEFYAPYLQYVEYLPKNASADSRLGAFDAFSAGVKYTFTLDRKSDLGVKVEYYQQKGQDTMEDAVGILKDADLFPEVSALVVQGFWTF